MSVKNIFFDLDGTLLPMDQDRFVEAYTTRLAAYVVPYGYDPELLVKALWRGTGAMVKNNGTRTNENAFWEVFSALVGKDARADLAIFDQFYQTDFQQVQNVCGFTPRAAETIGLLKEKGFRLILATNPLFPAAATMSRIRWAGLSPDDFVYCTTYENSTCCKPNIAYYEEILGKTGCKAEECVMVGNDVDEDMVAQQLGMQGFLLTDCLINRSQSDIARWPHGGFDELQQWLKNL